MPGGWGAARPRAYTCHLCGQQYGSKSLFIHVPQCEKKWEAQEECKPKRDRRPLPPRPPELDSGQLPTKPSEIDAFNANMTCYWDKMSLMNCPYCARSFRPAAFESHQKVCTPENPGGPLGPGRRMSQKGLTTPKHKLPQRSASLPPGVANRPRAYTCHICGLQYGSKSLMIHIPRCEKKWEEVEALKPNKRERRPVPTRPPELSKPLPTKPNEIDAFNEKMTTYWDKVSLISCPYCARTFRDEAFESHQKVCTPDNPGGPLGLKKGVKPDISKLASRNSFRGPGTSRGGGGGPTTFACYLCGHQYGSTSLSIHIPQCQAKWERMESIKTPQERRAMPPAPPELDKPLPTDAAGIEEFNNKMSIIYNTASLEACATCGRTFRSDALAKHIKMCGKKKETKPRFVFA